MRLSFSRRMTVAALTTFLAAGGAGAATLHTFSVSAGTGNGSEGASTFVQNSATGAALQGEVAASANTGIKIPFGVLGEYNAAGTTFGIGVAGLSSTGYGVAAEAFSSQPSILAISGGTGSALEVSSPNGGDAIYAVAQGQADTIDSYTEAPNSTSTSFYAATTGIDVSGDNGYNDGVYGYTENDGYGVDGRANSGSIAAVGAIGTGVTGLVAKSDSGTAAIAQSQTGDGLIAEQLTSGSVASYVYQQAGLYASSANGAGVYSYSAQDPAVVAEMGCNLYTSFATETGQNCSGVFIQEDGTAGYPLEIYEPGGGNCTYPMYVNSTGNVYICGSVVTGSVAKARNPGSDLETYAAQQTESTVEDLGSAQLVNGQARVPLNADFRKTIDGSQPYMVFMTPYGENRGLYVASRTPDGFVIRESSGARDSMQVDYRIVAHPAGQHLARLPHTTDVLNATGAPHRAVSYASLRQAADTRSPFPNTAKYRSIGQPMGDAMRARLLHPKVPANPFGLHAAR